ncbi:MAG: 2,4-dienoyl-CoA reductase [Clostridiales Family XIII bacterium]|jgi:2,4-dienoyl-CoA reductase-like NADH-dependent reductase (Old Yellow Enzyme family)|nr:2,4-dienoyl-CoA reductase [Clostridiales Family XIII bacterium]
MGYKETLLSPIKIGTREAQNRFFIHAMECNDEDETGNPSESTTERYENLARGEAGFLCLEAITVTRESRARDNQLTIMESNREPLKKFVARVKAANPKTLFIFQLTHSGELSSDEFSRRVTVNPLYGYGGELLSEGEVDKIMDDFVLAAQIAHDAGADGIDMKLCHGYFGSQVLRPYNSRDWKYGGEWKRRRQFAFDLYERISKAVNDKDFLIGSKISAWEGFPGGFGTDAPDSPVMDLTEPLDLLKGLEERGAQFFIQSAGSPGITISLTQVDKHIPYYAYLNQYWAKEFKKAVRPETVVIGSNFSVFRNGKNGLCAVDPKDAGLLPYGAKCIDDGLMDMVALGRQSFADPFLPKKLREGNEADIKWCTVCDNCLELLIRQTPVGCCTFNRRFAQILTEQRKLYGKLQETHT